jgi:hypothetical protein
MWKGRSKPSVSLRPLTTVPLGPAPGGCVPVTAVISDSSFAGSLSRTAGGTPD